MAAIWLLSRVLRYAAAPDNDGEFVLLDSPGDGHVLVIAERIGVPLASIEDVALAIAQAADTNARVVFRDKRRVKRGDRYFLKIETNFDTVPMVYKAAIFMPAKRGTVQVVTYTAKTLLPEHEREFMDFLNGFVVSK